MSDTQILLGYILSGTAFIIGTVVYIFSIGKLNRLYKDDLKQ